MVTQIKWKDFIERDPAILLSEKRVRALLSDIYKNDQLSINLLMNAFRIGIISEMRESYPVDHFTVARWSKKLVTDFAASARTLSDSDAFRAVSAAHAAG